MNRSNTAQQSIDEVIRGVLAAHGRIVLAVLFGSMADLRARSDSDVDIAVAADRALSADEKLALIGQLAERLGRPVDLIDLQTVGEPLLGEIIRHGRRVLGTDAAYASLISKHLFDQADFLPYRTRILDERRRAWIGS
jgi:predicted nucleotidyltransferase